MRYKCRVYKAVGIWRCDLLYGGIPIDRISCGSWKVAMSFVPLYERQVNTKVNP